MANVTQHPNMDMALMIPSGSSQSSSSKHHRRGKKHKTRKASDDFLDDATDSYAIVGVDHVDPTYRDAMLVNALIDAMTDMSATEDNPGMLDTWRKLMSVKASKVRRVCEDLLATVKRSHAQNGIPLGERKPVNLYPSFENRFDAVCATLQTQKTVCKHLMEDPYSYQVVDDPMQALRRVQNNRRVNQQKKEVIDKGRRYMGEKAQGRGRPNIKLDVEENISLADETVGSDSPVDADSDAVSECAAPAVKRESPRKPGTKRWYIESDSEEDENEQTRQRARVRSIKKRKIVSKSKEALQLQSSSPSSADSPSHDLQSAYSSPSNLQTVYSSPSNLQSLYSSPGNNATSEDPFATYEPNLAGPQMTPSYLNFNQPLHNYFNQYPYGDMFQTHTGLSPHSFGQHVMPMGSFSDQSMGYTSSNGPFFPNQHMGYTPSNGLLFSDQPIEGSQLTSNQLNAIQYPL